MDRSASSRLWVVFTVTAGLALLVVVVVAVALMTFSAAGSGPEGPSGPPGSSGQAVTGGETGQLPAGSAGSAQGAESDPEQWTGRIELSGILQTVMASGGQSERSHVLQTDAGRLAILLETGAPGLRQRVTAVLAVPEGHPIPETGAERLAVLEQLVLRSGSPLRVVELR